MNETLQRWLQAAREYLAGLSVQKKILIGVVAGLLLTTGIVGMLWVNQDPYQTLYSDLQPEDSKAVAKKLGESNIPYRLSEDTATVYVPTSQVHTARMELAKNGIPGQDVVGFEKFDGSTLGMSSYVQKIQYVRAVQGELTRSIQRLSSVKRARVHLSLPPKKTFLEEEEAPKASVILELRPGQTPSKSEINGIAHLTASAVEGLKVNSVTIVDTAGNFLHRPDENSAGTVSTAILENQRSTEVEYEKRIVELLTPVVGLGKVKAKVTAEMDSSRTNTTEETYDPDKAVLRSSLKNDEVQQGSRPNPIGIPGSRSNLPGTENVNPPVPMANTSTEKNMHNMNYAIPKKVQTVDKPSGSLKRLTVAVVVDGYYPNPSGKQEAPAFVPRTEEELKRLQDIVANAVGYDPERRDSITVSSLPFKAVDMPMGEEEAPQGISTTELYKNGIRNGLIGLVLILLFVFVVRPFLRWVTVQDVEKEIQMLPKTVAELEAVRKDEGILALSQAATMFEDGETGDKKEEESLRKRIVERLDSAPRKGYRIIQDWLDDDVVERLPEAA